MQGLQCLGRGHTAVATCSDKSRVILLCQLGIGRREVGDGAVEDVALAGRRFNAEGATRKRTKPLQ
jgi:hypothetical protein